MTATGFASAALVALVLAGLRRQGIAPPEVPLAAAMRHAQPLIALDRKRALLSAILSRHGPIALLRVGEAVAEQGFHPMLHALLRATGPVDLIGRWLRLERYAHSHHRTVADRLDAGCAALRHIALHGPPPTAAEDALVLGVQLALLREVGCRDVTAEVGGAILARADGSWSAPAAEAALAAGDTARWRLAWSGWEPRRRGSSDGAAKAPFGAPEFGFDGCHEATALAALMADDPSRRASVAELAAALGLSSRALQRRLAAHGLSASSVGRTVQVRHACLLLAGGDDALPAIGFAAGFSDQAHFTREFRKRVNMTPGAYRALARAGAAGDVSPWPRITIHSHAVTPSAKRATQVHGSR
jgi:AraC-like DNA-binding protein